MPSATYLALCSMRFFLLIFIPLVGMLIGLPLLGAWLAGFPPGPYLEFPPQTRFIRHAGFSWPAFVCMSALIVATILPVLLQALRSYRLSPRPAARAFTSLPVVGLDRVDSRRCGVGARMDSFPLDGSLSGAHLHPALAGLHCWRQCPLRPAHRPLLDDLSTGLFCGPVSRECCVFWWFFEYLNRFVQNWYYVGEHFDAWSYFWFATLPFATVLPAVLSTQELIRSFAGFRRAFRRMPSFSGFGRPLIPWTVLALSAGGLTGMAIAPSYLYPLVWVAPLLLLAALRGIGREPHVFQELTRTDWTGPACAALAAILCGFFWEMWNFYSLAKWKYSIPFVHRFEIFEMPVLGYFGYLPFGLECAVIGDWLQDLLKRNRGDLTDRTNGIILYNEGMGSPSGQGGSAQCLSSEFRDCPARYSCPNAAPRIQKSTPAGIASTASAAVMIVAACAAVRMAVDPAKESWPATQTRLDSRSIRPLRRSKNISFFTRQAVPHIPRLRLRVG